VQLFGRRVIAAPVRAVVHAPQLAGLRVEGETDGVAQPPGVEGASGAIEPRPDQRCVLGVRLDARVARAADGDVEHAVGADRERAVGVLAAVRQVCDERARRAESAVAAYVRNVNGCRRGEIRAALVQRDAVYALDAGDDDAL